MLTVTLDTDNHIAQLEPVEVLETADFVSAASLIDPLIEESGALKGLIIRVDHFPGWDSFGALASHLKFVRDHHRLIAKVAVVTDSEVLSLLPVFASHFVKANVKHFKGDEEAKALAWIAT